MVRWERGKTSTGMCPHAFPHAHLRVCTHLYVITEMRDRGERESEKKKSQQGGERKIQGGVGRRGWLE
ncbi:hypothetical protein POVCU2_0093640 [Plasmodium ovale curtisi]|uniref:Uncharacterized protein n=1 Tax=Plasmodium ovale curtisi TaxID=864141 RepID=A0A1A8WQI1_PLAOA|nr:hypothetical protein POVCU2_0093640 [Plasmodium ovale curtisi]SBT02896.1 hypothetical protein POVCU1_081910 [Plasmodium ovale curtisi]